MGMSEESIKAMKKAAEEGPAHMAAQKAHVEEVAAKEAARRAALNDDTLPEACTPRRKRRSPTSTRPVLPASTPK